MRAKSSSLPGFKSAKENSGQQFRKNIGAVSDFDPFLGLEHIRRDILDLSKPAFYGPAGIVHDLPVTQLSARRKGVRKSDLDRVLAARTRAPRKVAADLPSTN